MIGRRNGRMSIEGLIVFVLAMFGLPLGMLVAEFGFKETFRRFKIVLQEKVK